MGAGWNGPIQIKFLTWVNVYGELIWAKFIKIEDLVPGENFESGLGGIMDWSQTNTKTNGKRDIKTDYREMVGYSLKYSVSRLAIFLGVINLTPSSRFKT